MSSLNHCFDTNLAAQYSIEEAILIHHFQFWINKNKNLGRNLHEGRTWTYETREEIAAHFSYWSADQVKRILNKLVKNEIIIKGNFNKKGYDRTGWYAFKEEEKFISHREWAKSPNGLSEIAQPIPDTKTYTKEEPPLTPPSKKIEAKKKEDDLSKKEEIKKECIKKGMTSEIFEKAYYKYEQRPYGAIVSPVNWLLKTAQTVKEEDVMNVIVDRRKELCKKRTNWMIGKDGITITSGAIYNTYKFRGNESFWKKCGMGMKDLRDKLKHDISSKSQRS